MHMTSTNTRLFALTAGKVSAGLARGRLWQVKDGIARLRLLVHDEIQGEIEVPESGWFVVPESEMLQIQLVALSDITFESRLPINLIPRLGDLGRQQLIYPISSKTIRFKNFLIEIKDVSSELIEFIVIED